MKGTAALIYGLSSYAVFFVTFLYAIGFVGDIGVARSIDSGRAAPFGRALLINVLLLGLFALQHSLMARSAFKQWWTRFVPGPVERSTYVLTSSCLLLLLFWQWRVMPGVVWEVDSGMGRLVLRSLFIGGWAMVLTSSFIIDHFDLFGVRQVSLYARGKPYRPPEFRVSGLYKLVRHPLLLGFMIAFWSTPRMTVGHLLFAAVTSAYILIGIRLEERDLVRFHGEQYESYRRRVPMIVPVPRRPAAPMPDVGLRGQGAGGA